MCSGIVSLLWHAYVECWCQECNQLECIVLCFVQFVVFMTAVDVTMWCRYTLLLVLMCHYLPLGPHIHKYCHALLIFNYKNSVAKGLNIYYVWNSNSWVTSEKKDIKKLFFWNLTGYVFIVAVIVFVTLQ